MNKDGKLVPHSTSDGMVRPPLFRDQISNCTNLFGRNRTEPDTGYSHLLACSSVTYRGEMLHTYIFRSMMLLITYQPDIRTNRDVNRLQYSYIIW